MCVCAVWIGTGFQSIPVIGKYLNFKPNQKWGSNTERFEDTLAQCCPTQFQINFKFSNEELGKIKFNNIPHSIKYGQNSISMYSKQRIIFILPHTRQP